MNKDIIPTNAKGQPHGYWESYWANGRLCYKCVFINGKENGFEEEFWDNDGNITTKIYHL